MSVSLPSWVVTRTLFSHEYAPSECLDRRAEHHIEIYHVDTNEKFAYLSSVLPSDFTLRLKMIECNGQGYQRWVYGGSEKSVSPYCVVPVVTTIKKYYVQGWSRNDFWPGKVCLGELLDLLNRSPSVVDLRCNESLPINKASDEPTTCKYFYRKGKKQGQTCGKACDASGYCTQCNKKKGVVKLLASKPCVYTFRDGRVCGKMAFESDYCVGCRKKKGVKMILSEA